MCPFTNDTAVYMRNPRFLPLELIIKFSMATEYKITRKKLITFYMLTLTL